MDDKLELRTHLASLGIEIGLPRQLVHDKLRRYLGTERFEQFLAQQKSADANALYDFVRDWTEANLFRSLALDLVPETAYELYRRCAVSIKPGAHILELGCWTGGLAAFIAKKMSHCHVTAVDRVSRVVEWNRSAYGLSNLEFYTWDYSTEKPLEVQPADVLLCSLGINRYTINGYAVDGSGLSVRQDTAYAKQKAEASTYFRQWRAAAKDGARLFAVLKVSLFGQFVAFVDAAQEAGWRPVFDFFGRVEAPLAKEVLPSLAFVAAPCPPVPEEVLLAEHVRLSTGPSPIATFRGSAALGVYASLSGKRLLRRRKRSRQNGPLVQDEVGLSGALGYIFSRNSHSYAELILVSFEKAFQTSSEWEKAKPASEPQLIRIRAVSDQPCASSTSS